MRRVAHVVKIRLTAALAAALLAVGMASAAENDVLYWMVDGSTALQRDDGTMTTVQAFLGESADSSFAARVRVTGGDITGDTFLRLYDGDGVVYDGDLGVDFGKTGAGYWGAGVPDGNRSPSGDYSAGTPEYSFIVEIGNVVWNAAGDDGTWTTVATSSASTYSSLASFIIPLGDIKPSGMVAWNPSQFHAVPEPSSGLLVLIGGAVLALRRKRRTKEA